MDYKRHMYVRFGAYCEISKAYNLGPKFSYHAAPPANASDVYADDLDGKYSIAAAVVTSMQ